MNLSTSRPESYIVSPDASKLPVTLLVAIAVVYGGFNIGRSVLGPGRGIDFAQYYVAGRLVLAGEPETMYDTGTLYQAKARSFGVKGVPWESGVREVMTYAYTPLVAYLMVPLALLPYRVAASVFSLASMMALIAGIALLVVNREARRRQVLLWSGLLAAMAFAPVHLTLHTGQINCLLFLCLALGLYFARRDKALFAGLFIALAVHIKLSPLVLLPFFVIRRQFRLAAVSLLFVIVLAVLTAAAGGLDLYHLFLSKVLPSQYFAGAYYRNQGFDGFFTRLLTQNGYVQSLGDHPVLARILASIAGVVVVAVTYLVTSRRAADESVRYDLGYSLCLVAALLFQAKSYEHHAVLLLFCFLFVFEVLAYGQPDRRRLLMLVFLCFAVWAFMLTLDSEYEKLPKFVVLNLLYSGKFLATLVLWAVGVRLLAGKRPLMMLNRDAGT